MDQPAPEAHLDAVGFPGAKALVTAGLVKAQRHAQSHTATASLSISSRYGFLRVGVVGREVF